MSIEGVIEKMQALGIALGLREDKLFIGAKASELDPGLLAELRSNKGALEAHFRGGTGRRQADPIVAAERGAAAPASFGQQRLWMIDRMGAGSVQYHMPTVLQLDGPLDVALLRQALDLICARHDVLRTTYRNDGEQVLQSVSPGPLPALTPLDLQAEADPRLAALCACEALIAAPFDLARDWPIRLGLFRLAPERHVLALVLHHIASDGWSGAIVVREFCQAYQALQAGVAPALDILPIQYADYARWQHQPAQQERYAHQLQYWQRQLAGMPELHALPLDKPRPARLGAAGRSHSVPLRAELAQGLRALCGAEGATLFMGLHAVLSALLARFSGADDIVLGTPVANRGQDEIAALVGFFVNTVVLRADLSEPLSLRQLLQQCRHTCLQAYAHQELPFERLVEALRPQRSLSHTPLFQVMLSLENNETATLDLGRLRVAPFEVEALTAQFDLTLEAWEQGDTVCLRWEYSTELFEHASIERLADSFCCLLEGALAAPDQALASLPLLGQAQQARLIELGAVAPTGASDDATLPQRCSRIAQRFPGAIAVEDAERSLRYDDLERASNRLAQYLLRAGVMPGQLVAFCAERGVLLPVMALGVMKAGAAYVALTPEMAPAHVAALVADAAISWLVVDAAGEAVVAGCGAALIRIDAVLADSALSDAPTGVRLAPDAPAYASFNPDSAGRASCVLVGHASLSAMADAWRALDRAAPGSARWLQTAAASETAFATDMLRTLGTGHTLVIGPRQVVADPAALADWLRSRRIDAACFAPAQLRALCTHEQRAPRSGLPLRLVVVDADRWYGVDRAQALAVFGGGVRLLHTYGAAEAALGLYAELGADTARAGLAPVARPFSGSRVYILDRAQALAPLGVIGELCIGGAGVAHGYLGQARHQDQRLLPDHFSGAGGRLFRTGEQARLRADGSVELVGRTARHVTLRGLRIELGEIEAALLQLSAVRRAVVSALDGSAGPRLVAHVVAPADRWDARQADAELRRVLPGHMVPAALVRLDALPLNAQGELERAALPPPEAVGDSPPAPPAGACQQWLAQCWETLLQPGRPVAGSDNFFALGGHSLLAMRMLTQIKRERQVELAVTDIFDTQTLAALAARIDAASPVTSTPIVPQPAQPAAPLSFAQQRLWLIDQLGDGRSTEYHMPVLLKLDGQLQLEPLRQAYNTVLQRHQVLRSIYRAEGDQVSQVLCDDALPVLPLDDLRAAPAPAALAQRLAQEGFEQPFDLARDIPVRARLFKLAEREHVLALLIHHIACDGWSMGLVVRELSQAYQAACDGLAAPLEALPVQYADYARWQRQPGQTHMLERQLGYWRAKLAGLPKLHGLPLDRPRPAQQSFAGQLLSTRIDAALTARLQAFCRAEGATLFMGLHALLSALLARYSGQHDIVVGAPIANREQPEVAALVGFFANTLVLRADLSEAPNLGQLVRQSKQLSLEAYANQQLPFDQLVQALQPQRSPAHTPLFQIMLTMQNQADEALHLPGLTISTLDPGQPGAQFDLALAIEEGDAGLQLSWTYASALFDASSIARLAGNFAVLLEAALARPGDPFDRWSLLTAPERGAVLRDWQGAAALPDDACVHQLVERQARRTPQAVAVSCDGRQWRYAELNAGANRLARQLQRHGVGPNSRVALCASRSGEMLIALLAILKAGAAYVPLDPDYPAQRLAFLLQDSAPAVLLADADGLRVLGGAQAQDDALVLLDIGAADQWADQPAHDLPAGADGHDAGHAAYVIYTSGSTGRPKGVLVEHRSLVNHIGWQCKAYAFSAHDVFLQRTPISFDASVWELWTPLAIGARLALLPQRAAKDVLQIAETIVAEQVSIVQFVPSLLDTVLREAVRPDFQCRMIFCGGEPLGRDLARRAQEVARDGVVNLYGPTEATIDATAWHCGDAAPDGPGVPIGRPLDNVAVYVLDQHRQPVPVGVVGELYIGGAGVARAYLNQPELTGERFLPDPFAASRDARMYRSGDLGRWRDGGVLEYAGRADEQVKLHGLRVELGEIEAQLRQHDALRDAVVIAHAAADGDAGLLAFVQTVPGKAAPDSAELRHFLLQALPEYMAPWRFQTLPAWPTLPNGKIDRKALPALAHGAGSSQAFEAPRGAIERGIAAVWSELLGLPRMGRHDNFFMLGGHSLLAVRSAARLHKLGLRIAAKAIFSAPTPAGLAQLLGQQGLAAAPVAPIPLGCAQILPAMLPLIALGANEIDQAVRHVAGGSANVQDIYPLVPLQQGILFEHLMASVDDPYVLPVLMRFDTRGRVDGFLAALQEVIARHDILRTSIAWEGLDVPAQVVWRAAALPLTEAGIASGQGDIASQLQAQLCPTGLRLDLRRAPLMAAAVAFDADSGRWVLLLLHHHLVLDHTAMEVLLEEVLAILQGRQAQLPAPVPYRHFVVQSLEAGDTGEQEAFFRAMLGEVRTPTLPFGLGSLPPRAPQLDEARIELAPEMSQRVRAQARRAGTSTASVFHLAWAQVLACLCGRGDVVFGTVLFGRMHGGAGVERAMGLFINTLPIRLNLGAGGAQAVLRQTHATLSELLKYEHTPLNVAQRCSAVAAPTPLFSTLLNCRHAIQDGNPDGAGWEGIELLSEGERSTFPLSVDIDDLGDLFGVTVQAAAALPARAIRDLLCLALERLLGALEQDPERSLERLELLSGQQLAALLAHNVPAPASGGAGGLRSLSFAQQAQLHGLQAGLEPGPQDNLPLMLRLRGGLRPDALAAALERVLERHQGLRMLCVRAGDQPRLQLQDVPQVKLELVDLVHSQLSDEHLAWELEAFAETPFDLFAELGVRARLFQRTEHDYVLALVFHRMLCDPASAALVAGAIMRAYDDVCGQGAPALAPLALQYADVADWQRALREQGRFDADLVYWRQHLRGMPAVHGLPLDRPRTAQARFAAGRLNSQIDGAALHRFCRREGVSLLTALHSAFAVLIARYSGQADTVIGTVEEGRERAEFGSLLGCFCDMLVLRLDVSDDANFLQLARRSQQLLRAARVHRIAFGLLVEELLAQPAASQAPLVQIVLNVHEPAAPAAGLMSATGVACEPFELALPYTHAELSLDVVPAGDCLQLHWTYCADLFDAATIAAMADAFACLATAALEQPQVAVDALPLLSAPQVQRLLAVGAPGLTVPSSGPRCIHRIFEQQAALAPSALAVRQGGIELDYAELDRRANRLAHWLRAHGVGTGVAVGVYLHRGVELMVALLAIWKADGAYLPLDPAYPAARLSHMLGDAAPPVILSEEALSGGLPAHQIACLCLDTQWPAQQANYPAFAPPSAATPDDMAYLMYTSGSSGKPKGVMVSHANASSFVDAASERYARSGPQRVLQFASISFDIFIEELCLSLLCGGSLHLRGSAQTPTPQQFWQGVGDEAITLVSLPTAYWHLLCDELDQDQIAIARASLRLCIVGGEAMRADAAGVWLQRMGQEVELFNGYGPTEATVIASGDMVRRVAGPPSLGRPLGNARCYVVNRAGVLQPHGVAGELWIGGDGVASAYWQRPDLSAQRFTADPFVGGRARLYRTGDLVSWDRQGRLCFHGRIDDQVKVQGFRVETGEVEAALRALPAVRDVRVAAESANGAARLVAYVVAAPAHRDAAALRAQLQRHLPAYMVPALYVFMDALPLTANGKIDRAALPLPREPAAAADLARRDPRHAALCALWAEVLGLPDVEPDENFFVLGGDSIRAMRLVNRCRAAGLDFGLRELYAGQTVRALSGQLEMLTHTAAAP